MPHQCVRCNEFYDDGSAQILKGCPCGGKLFFFISKEKLERIKKQTVQLSAEQKKQIEDDVYDLVGDSISRDEPVVLDLESIKILKPGQFELDLVNLFKKDHPLVYKLEEGKYMIDIPQTFRKMKEKKKKS